MVSSDIFKSWDRAIKWNTATNATTFADVRQTDQFENHALSWNSTGRDPDLLLHVDQSLDRAVKLLAQHAEEPMLSPLAKEFLEASVDASRHRIRGRKVMRQVGYPALAALFVIGLAYFAVSNYSGKSDKSVGKPIVEITAPSGLASSPKTSIQTTIPAVGAVVTVLEPPSAPVIQALSQKPISKPVLDPELMDLAARISGIKPPKPALKPVNKTAPKPKIKKAPALSIPDGLTAQSTAGEITTSVEYHLADRKIDRALESIYFLFARTDLETGAIRPSASELRRLSVSLGKIPMLQGDQKGVKYGWKIGLANSSRGVDAIPADVRLLMARTAANANRNEESTAILFDSRNNVSAAMTNAASAILSLEFGDDSAKTAAAPQNDFTLISNLPVSDEVKSTLRESTIVANFRQ